MFRPVYLTFTDPALDTARRGDANLPEGESEKMVNEG
jgi:hypothetical protein